MKRLQTLSKSKLMGLAIALYVLLSATYIISNRWQDYQMHIIEQAFFNGRRQTIEELIQQVNQGCGPVPIYLDNEEIAVIKADCLQEMAEGRANEDSVYVSKDSRY